jgi:tetratricopeptide (TPR) repeat protein
MNQSRIRPVFGVLAIALWVGCASQPPPPPDPGAVAAAYAEAGRYDEAAREIDIAVRTHPKDLALRHQAAAIHASAGNPNKAVSHLETALQDEPENAATWLQLGDIEKSRENLADAYVAYRRASVLDPQSLPAISGLALTADQLGFSEEAENAYARWAALDKELGVDTLPADQK